jgi:hypothetical protein
VGLDALLFVKLERVLADSVVSTGAAQACATHLSLAVPDGQPRMLRHFEMSAASARKRSCLPTARPERRPLIALGLGAVHMMIFALSVSSKTHTKLVPPLRRAL